MKRLVALLMALCLAITPAVVFAEEDTTDVLDSSAELAEAEEIGIPTEAMVNEMKANADSLYEEGKYEEAAEAYYETAKKANYLANIMLKCLEPYYSDSSASMPDEIHNNLTDMRVEKTLLINTRNICYVYQGICYNKIGDSEKALATLYKSLGLIEYYQDDAWTLAVQEVMKIIEFK